MRSRYFNRAGEPISRNEWNAELGKEKANRVVFTRVADAEVSTAWLGLNHAAWDSSPPLIFETMVFGGAHGGWHWRYSTEDEARTGHERVVAALREGRNP